MAATPPDCPGLNQRNDMGAEGLLPQGDDTPGLSPEEAFYAEVLAEAAAAAFERAMAIDGLEGEIALLRTRLLEVMQKQPERIDLCTKLAESIARLVNAQHRLAKGKKRGLKDNFAKILTDLAIPLGPVAVRLLLKRVNGIH